MSQDVTCWLCGRTEVEVAAAVGETEAEMKMKGRMDELREKRGELMERSSRWKKDFPERFQEFELAFILQNAEQFKSIGYLDQLTDVGRGALRELDDISQRARSEMENAATAQPDKQGTPLVILRLDEFEGKTKRRLKREEDMRNPNYQSLGYIGRLKGLTSLDGLDYLRDAGLFYYDLQIELLESERASEDNRRPSFKIRMVKFSDYFRGVPVCSVCERLVKELRTTDEASAR
jgi:hypothetical protein